MKKISVILLALALTFGALYPFSVFAESRDEQKVSELSLERTPVEIDQLILSLADQRRESILNSPTEIVKSDVYIPGKTYTGKAYYVANDGNDRNKGTSPNAPWKTIERVVSAKLKPGDAVFFRRGDIWREGYMYGRQGVTYSAYGEGVKPRFYASPENGAGAEKWKLWRTTEDGAKIWTFYQAMSDCGNIVLNEGESYASRVYADWNGESFVFFHNRNETFDVEKALQFDLQFFSEFDLTGYSLPMFVCDKNTMGTLYLRCDAGNPGSLYDSIEFQSSSRPSPGYFGIVSAEGSDIVFDNLCVRYGSAQGIKAHMEEGIVIQNCEVGWIGGGTLHYTGDAWAVAAAGEGIAVHAQNTAVQNCYIHNCWDGGIISELGDNPYDHIQGFRVIGNLIERCHTGVMLGVHERALAEDVVNLKDIDICDNIILYSGYSFSTDPHYGLTSFVTQWDTVSAAIGCWTKEYKGEEVHISRNILYLAKFSLITNGAFGGNRPILNGNTYVQMKDKLVAIWRDDAGSIQRIRADNDNSMKDAIQNILHDIEAIVAPLQ